MSNNQSKIDINTMMSRIEQPTPIKDNSSQLVPTQLDTIKFNGDNYKLSLKWIKSICDQLTKQYGDTAVRVVFIPQNKEIERSMWDNSCLFIANLVSNEEIQIEWKTGKITSVKKNNVLPSITLATYYPIFANTLNNIATKKSLVFSDKGGVSNNGN